ncbi:hypothetical protein KVR01_003696 [Diaporthe batatas]|uniref:uncharacterized protein n=1 Tax=Diaporthe batatas TaxID=748121 RepID=UPI001D03B5F7|nr:uncharacterized protein KVR01_003696 [Diaporthe batatas]KAG8168007.1 hypothetical protein KVR01_003696 [Diaporthe batatas]
MLGKLFNLGNTPGNSNQAQPSTSKQVSSLESVQEDIHTRSLLFPDAQTLYQHQNDQVFPMSSASVLPLQTSVANPYDLDGDLEIESRDVRVIIMQDTSSSSPASLLYDSQRPQLPQEPSPTERPQTMAGMSQALPQDSRRFASAQRKTSTGQSSKPVVIQPGSPQPRQSAFDRRASMHSRTQSKAETESQKLLREYKQEIDTFAGCIFGNNEFLAYKGTSTKVHVVPSDMRNDVPSSGLGDGRGSIGRSATRTSKLSQSFSSEAVPPFKPSVSSPLPRSSDRKRVLITRLFPVSIPADDTLACTPKGRFSEESSGFPFPQSSDEAKAKAKKAQLKQKRTPMYAVALIISLPPGLPQTAPASASRSAFRGSSSYNEQQDSFPSSYNSARRSGWATVGPSFGGFEALDAGFSMDSEERIDAITRHWDVIMRSLTSLQSTVATELFALLKQADIASPNPAPSSVNSHFPRAPSNASQKPPKTNTKFISLLPNCLANDKLVKEEVDAARARIVLGLRATRVVTGQNRWGIWREEARWVERWAGGRDQGFFFFNLLTGFLSVHTDWLQALSPSRYRRQFSALQKLKSDDDLSLPARTIVVSQDRVAARRLIFLLSAFLPANQQLLSMRTQRPQTSASFGGFSQSPPSFIIPLTKEESLRRKINRRGASRHASHSRTASTYTTSTKVSVPAHLAHLSMDGQHGRRASDAASIRTSLPLQGSDTDSRKASAATTATVTQEHSTIIPHFATQNSESQAYGHPDSSMAADDLKRSLKRGDSMGSSDTQTSSRWSVISGLWNTRRRESSLSTAPNRDSPGSRDSIPVSPRKPVSNRRNSLAKMVEEAAALDPMSSQARTRNSPKERDAESPETPDAEQGPGQRSRAPIPMERKPDPSGAFESPVKTTINPEDGVIDVDVPFPDFIASFETAVSSPSSSGYLSTPGLSGLELFEQASRVAFDGDVPMNVAGWLQRYHPDFILQAIPPQNDLVEQVKASLRAEPTPYPAALADGNEEKWVDVSSALIADSTDFSIRRVRYRRLIKPRSGAERTTPLLSSSVNTMSSTNMTPLISPYEHHLQEDFVEEPIVTLDDTLIEAVERVIAHGSDMSKDSSQCSSRSTSKRRESFADLLAAAAASTTVSNTVGLAPEVEVAQGSTQPRKGSPQQGEVPRGECKTVVLSALENIARDVTQRKSEREELGRASSGGPRGREKESVLREAVRSWVEGVDAGMEASQ